MVPWHWEQPCLIIAILPFSGAAAARTRNRRKSEAGGERRQPDAFYQLIHHFVPHRGCVTTSTSAGWPDFTTSPARLNVAARSFGSVIGPAAHHPIDAASLA